MSVAWIATQPASLGYLSAEAPTPTPGNLHPTGQLAYSIGFQYPSPQQLFSEGGVQGFQISVPLYIVRSHLNKSDR